MGCNLEWDNTEHTIARLTLNTGWSFNCIDDLTPAINQEIIRNSKLVGAIIHLVNPIYIPNNALRGFQRQLQYKPHEVIITVFVVPNTPLVNTLFGVVERMGQRDHHIVLKCETLDKARNIIYQHLDQQHKRPYRPRKAYTRPAPDVI